MRGGAASARAPPAPEPPSLSLDVLPLELTSPASVRALAAAVVAATAPPAGRRGGIGGGGGGGSDEGSGGEVGEDPSGGGGGDPRCLLLLVNNAGCCPAAASRQACVGPVNVVGPAALTAALLPHMPRGGRVLNVGSFTHRAAWLAGGGTGTGEKIRGEERGDGVGRGGELLEHLVQFLGGGVGGGSDITAGVGGVSGVGGGGDGDACFTRWLGAAEAAFEGGDGREGEGGGASVDPGGGGRGGHGGRGRRGGGSRGGVGGGGGGGSGCCLVGTLSGPPWAPPPPYISPPAAYSLSKLALTCLSDVIQRDAAARGVAVVTLDPGLLDTAINGDWPTGLRALYAVPLRAVGLLRAPARGAEGLLAAACADLSGRDAAGGGGDGGGGGGGGGGVQSEGAGGRDGGAAYLYGPRAVWARPGGGVQRPAVTAAVEGLWARVQERWA